MGRDPYRYPSEDGKRDIVQIPSSSVVIAAVCRKGTHLSDAVVRGVTSVLKSITTPPDDTGAHASSVCCCRISRWSSFARVCALLSDSSPPNPTFVFSSCLCLFYMSLHTFVVPMCFLYCSPLCICSRCSLCMSLGLSLCMSLQLSASLSVSICPVNSFIHEHRACILIFRKSFLR